MNAGKTRDGRAANGERPKACGFGDGIFFEIEINFEERPMKTRLLTALLLIVATASPATAQDVVTYVWDPGCNHMMKTNHFVLPAGKEVSIYVDLSECTDEQRGSLLFFGDHPTKTRSRQFSKKDKILLTMQAEYESGSLSQPTQSDTGSMLADVGSVSARGCHLTAKNMNRNKDLTIRLRSYLIEP